MCIDSKKEFIIAYYKISLCKISEHQNNFQYTEHDIEQ